MAAPARLGVAPTGLVAEGHRGSVGRQLRRRVPVDQARPRAGRGGPAHSTPPRWASEADVRAARADPGVVGPRGRGVRVPGRCLDRPPHRRRHLAYLWRPLPSRPCQSVVAARRLESPAADRAGDPARRGGDSALVRRALAGAQKKAAAEGSTIVWVDEAGLYLLPLAVRTWAPRGQTPVLQVTLTRDHLAAISGITLDGRLFMQTQEPAYTAEAVVGLLRVMVRKIPGKILVISDGSPLHKGPPITAFLQAGAAKRLHLERLPGYAPDLNPDEGIWNYLKRVELKNRCCRDLAELAVELRRAKERLRHKRDVIRACSLQCGYSV